MLLTDLVLGFHLLLLRARQVDSLLKDVRYIVIIITIYVLNFFTAIHSVQLGKDEKDGYLSVNLD